MKMTQFQAEYIDTYGSPQAPPAAGNQICISTAKTQQKRSFLK
jgi:hypothetical protein